MKDALRAWEPTVEWVEDGYVAHVNGVYVGFVRPHSVFGYMWALHQIFIEIDTREGYAADPEDAKRGLEKAYASTMRRFLAIEA